MPLRINPVDGNLDLVIPGTTSFATDSGSAAPTAGGVITIAGGTGISTSGASNTVTIDLDVPVTVALGGTGRTTLTDGAVLVGDGTSAVEQITLTNGQLLIGSTGASPSAATLTAGNGVVVTNGAGSITIAADFASTAEALAGTSLIDVISPSTLNDVLAPMTMTGFASWSDSGNYYTLTGTKFSLLRGGTGYIKSKLVTWVKDQTTASLAQGATYYVYIDSSGLLQTTTTRNKALFENNIVLFEMLVDNAGTANVVVVRENHPYDYQTAISSDLHDTIHVVLEGTGAIIAVSGTDDIEIQGADELHDHGLETDIPDSGSSPVTFQFVFTDAGGKWVKDSAATSFPSEYNNAGTMTALSANKYGVWRLYVSKDDLNTSTPTYFAVAHTAQFNNLAAARTAISDTGVAGATNELAALELAQLGFVIYEQSSSSIAEVEVARSILGTSLVGASSDTAALTTVNTDNFSGWLSPSDTTVQTALETLDKTISPGVYNIGINYNAGTFKITGADGTALSVNNPGYAVVPSQTSPGYFVKIAVTADQDFIDDAGASQIVNNLFGLTTSIAWAQDIPFFLYAVPNDSADAIAFMISRNPAAIVSPAAANIGAPDDAVADAQGDFWSLENIDESVYDANPCVLIGAFRMQMSASDDWTVQTLDDTDGIGRFHEETLFTFPSGVNGATTGTYLYNGAGTEPVWGSNTMQYKIGRDGRVWYSFAGLNASTPGSGGAAVLPVLPYAVGSKAQYTGLGVFIDDSDSSRKTLNASAAASGSAMDAVWLLGTAGALTLDHVDADDDLVIDFYYKAF